MHEPSTRQAAACPCWTPTQQPYTEPRGIMAMCTRVQARPAAAAAAARLFRHRATRASTVMAPSTMMPFRAFSVGAAEVRRQVGQEVPAGQGSRKDRRPLSPDEKKAKIASAWNSSAEAYVASYQAGMEGILSPGMSAGYKLAARLVSGVGNKRCEEPIIPGYEMCKARATHGDAREGATACDLHKTDGMVRLKESETPVVLDVASAGGEPALTIAKIVPNAKIHATDVAPAMVEHIRKRMAEAGVTNVEAGIADGESLVQFEDGSVDVVTCTWGLMFMPNWKKALQEFSRVLRSDGIMVVTLWERDPDSIFQRMAKVLETLSPGFQGLLDPEALGEEGGLATMKEMDKAGLADVTVSKFSVPVTLPSGSGLREIWETCALSTPLEQTMASMEARGRKNVREEAFQIFEAQMHEDWAEGRSPFGLSPPPSREVLPEGGLGEPSSFAYGEEAARVFFVKALAVLGRKRRH